MPDDRRPATRRILLKVSGEVLMGDSAFGIDTEDRRRRGRGHRRGASTTGVELCLVIGGGNIFRGLSMAGRGHGARQRRLHGHAGHGDERPGHAGRAGEDRRLHPRAVGHPDGRGLRALHPPPRPAAPGKGPGGDLRRRHSARRSSPPTPPPPCAPPRWAATPCSRAPASTASIPPTPRRTRRAKRYDTPELSGGAGQGPAGHGRLGHQPDARQRHPDRGLLDPRAGQSAARC